jgi:hypothetical protein
MNCSLNTCMESQVVVNLNFLYSRLMYGRRMLEPLACSIAFL